MPSQRPMNQDQKVTSSQRPWSSYRLWAWRGALGLFLGYLLLRALQIRSAAFEPVHWAFNSQREIAAWLGGVLWHELIVFGLFFLLGVLVPPALGPDQKRQPPGRWCQPASPWSTPVLAGPGQMPNDACRVALGRVTHACRRRSHARCVLTRVSCRLRSPLRGCRPVPVFPPASRRCLPCSLLPSSIMDYLE